jgi:hypothetical protein
MRCKRHALTVDANGEPPFIFEGADQKIKKSRQMSSKDLHFKKDARVNTTHTLLQKLVN